MEYLFGTISLHVTVFLTWLFFQIVDITHTMFGKFHFVDLAGSERAHRTGNVGDRFKGQRPRYFEKYIGKQLPVSIIFLKKKKEFLSNIDIFKYRICTYKLGFAGLG